MTQSLTRLNVPEQNSLADYVTQLNYRALKNNNRVYDFVPRAGTVIMVSCDNDHHVSITVANGKGGLTHHKMPEGVFFKCSRFEQKVKPSLISRIRKFFGK